MSSRGQRLIISIAPRTFRAVAPTCFGVDPRDVEAAIASPWWLARVRGQFERKVAGKLQCLSVPHVLPLAEYERRTPNGTRRVTLRALFPGYLLLSGMGLYAVNSPRSELPGLLSTHPVPDVPTLVSDLARLMDLIESGAPIGGESKPIAPGERVRIGSGICEGYEGLYIRDQGEDLIWLDVAMIGRMVPMAVERWRIERITPE